VLGLQACATTPTLTSLFEASFNIFSVYTVESAFRERVKTPSGEMGKVGKEDHGVPGSAGGE
jgi:hypothetical protein